MEIWSEIRRQVLTGALSKRAAIAKYGIGWQTLKKMLAHDEPPGYRQAQQNPTQNPTQLLLAGGRRRSH
jgi:transposase